MLLYICCWLRLCKHRTPAYCLPHKTGLTCRATNNTKCWTGSSVASVNFKLFSSLNHIFSLLLNIFSLCLQHNMCFCPGRLMTHIKQVTGLHCRSHSFDLLLLNVKTQNVAVSQFLLKWNEDKLIIIIIILASGSSTNIYECKAKAGNQRCIVTTVWS